MTQSINTTNSCCFKQYLSTKMEANSKEYLEFQLPIRSGEKHHSLVRYIIAKGLISSTIKFCTCVIIICTFLIRPLQINNVKWPNSAYFGEREPRWQRFHISIRNWTLSLHNQLEQKNLFIHLVWFRQLIAKRSERLRFLARNIFYTSRFSASCERREVVTYFWAVLDTLNRSR